MQMAYEIRGQEVMMGKTSDPAFTENAVALSCPEVTHIT
jgi:hypothetical protein